jgi:hypothetical protein
VKKNLPLSSKCVTCNEVIVPEGRTWQSVLAQKCITPLGKIQVPHIPAQKF